MRQEPLEIRSILEASFAGAKRGRRSRCQRPTTVGGEECMFQDMPRLLLRVKVYFQPPPWHLTRPRSPPAVVGPCPTLPGDMRGSRYGPQPWGWVTQRVRSLESFGYLWGLSMACALGSRPGLSFAPHPPSITRVWCDIYVFSVLLATNTWARTLGKSDKGPNF